MKVLVESDNQKNPRQVCRKCNAVYEFNINDVQSEYTLLGKRKFVTCPCCGETTNMFYLGTNGQAYDNLKKKLYGEK